MSSHTTAIYERLENHCRPTHLDAMEAVLKLVIIQGVRLGSDMKAFDRVLDGKRRGLELEPNNPVWKEELAQTTLEHDTCMASIDEFSKKAALQLHNCIRSETRSLIKSMASEGVFSTMGQHSEGSTVDPVALRLLEKNIAHEAKERDDAIKAQNIELAQLRADLERYRQSHPAPPNSRSTQDFDPSKFNTDTQPLQDDINDLRQRVCDLEQHVYTLGVDFTAALSEMGPELQSAAFHIKEDVSETAQSIITLHHDKMCDFFKETVTNLSNRIDNAEKMLNINNTHSHPSQAQVSSPIRTSSQTNTGISDTSPNDTNRMQFENDGKVPSKTMGYFQMREEEERRKSQPSIQKGEFSINATPFHQFEGEDEVHSLPSKSAVAKSSRLSERVPVSSFGTSCRPSDPRLRKINRTN